MLDGFDALLFIRPALGGRRVRHVTKRHQLGLLSVVERTAHLDGIALREAHARFEEIERALPPTRPTDSVALVMMTVGTLSNSCSRITGPMSIGAAARVSLGFPRRLSYVSSQ